MRFFSIAGVELRKLFKKPLTLVMLGTLFVPLFYTYSILTDAPLLQMTPSGALDFALGQWGLLGMTGLFQVLFSLVVVNTLSAEVDRGQIKMVVMRECARKRLIYAKMAVLTLSMILCYVVFLGFCILCYYTLVVHTDYGTGEWVSEAVRSLGLGRFAMSGLFTLLDTLMTTGIIFLFSLRCRTGICPGRVRTSGQWRLAVRSRRLETLNFQLSTLNFQLSRQGRLGRPRSATSASRRLKARSSRSSTTMPIPTRTGLNTPSAIAATRRLAPSAGLV